MTPPAPAPDIDQAVRVEQARALQANVLPLVGGNVVMTAVVGWALWGLAPHATLGLWIALQAAQSAWGAVLALRARQRPATARNATRRLRRITHGVVANSVLWATGLVVFWPQQPELILLLALIASGLSTNVVHAAVAWLPLVRGYLTLMSLAVAAAALFAGGRLNWLIALVAVVHLLASLRLAHQLHRTVMEALRGRHELARLSADLEAQRDRAEEASAAKSRFLAAASHDLRQPVHALTLMLGAWRAQPTGPEAERMRERVESTVAAMGSLFNALLDVSRLDAGMVRVQARPLALAPLLARLMAEMAEPARARGLVLRSSSRVNVDSLTLHTDGMLLERVLRNLLDNAVRYTECGGVLVAARARSGRVVLRIADTGLGIPREQQEAVFQEFVQLHNPERDRSLGLGLGLAIVRRLCGLLAIELTLRSRVGRGTVFTLRLPTAQAPAQAVGFDEAAAGGLPPDASGGVAPDAAPAGGELVLVIDDDADIRAGMSALLTSWGHEVVCAGALAELRPALLPLARVPGLIVCDYRLRGGETGVRVVAVLRDEFNDDDLPALLITGDTAPDRLLEAAASGLAVLHKPVHPERLRAAVNGLLRSAPETAAAAAPVTARARLP